MAFSAEPTVTELLQRAEGLSKLRAEAMSGVHLLASLGAASGSVRDLLEERGAGFRRILDRWEGMLDRGAPDNLDLIVRATQAMARRFGVRVATAPHLLLALLGDGSSSVRRVLEAADVDVSALRQAGLQLAQGLPTRRARPSAEPLVPLLPRGDGPRGIAVPVMPAVPVKGPFAGRVPTVSVRGAGVGQAVPLLPTPKPSATLPASAVVAEAVGPIEAVPHPTRKPLRADSSPRGNESRNTEPHPRPSGAFARGGPEPARADLLLDEKEFPILTRIGKNLSWLAATGKTDEVVGREEEIEHALDVLAKRHGNSPCLIGPAGVGKTTVARGIAAKLANRADDEGPRILIELPISELFAGTGVRGALASRLSSIKKEVGAAGGQVVLFFDEIHQLFQGDQAEEIASDLKVILARGELPCIGATSIEEYRRVIEADGALQRRFTPIDIEEPSREEAYLVLRSVAERLARHHRVSYDDEALSQAIAWAVRYLPGRALPDKVVSVADLAGARSRRRGKDRVDREAMAEVIALEAAMPIERLLQSDAERMLALEDILAERVIGHTSQIRKIARILRRNAAGLGSRRPIGTFLLLGPTGVGKTETAKAIAEVLFQTETAMTRIDMAEMSEAHAVARLVGAPPGYIGHDAGGQLTEAVRRRPYQVILLDEVEKAHPDVLTAFLAVLDEGRMTDSRGRLVDFTSTVILLTSNLGASEASQAKRGKVGFQSRESAPDLGIERIAQAARQALPPELYNRLDEVLTFAPLSRIDVARIGDKLLKRLGDELELSRAVTLAVEFGVVDHLLDHGGYDVELGARPLRRTIARLIEAPLAEAILSGRLRPGESWVVSVAGDELRGEALPRGASAAE
jgi:ATP-dependent Clp protease ATP-binding subunit ClpC